MGALLIALGMSAQMLPTLGKTQKASKRSKMRIVQTDNQVMRAPNKADDSAYAWEPTDASTQSFSDVTGTSTHYVDGYEDGSVDVYDILLSNDVCTAELYLHASLNSPDKLPAGTYPINDTYDANTALASPGGDDYYDYPSFVGTNIEDGYYNDAYYLVSGEVEVSYEGEDMNIRVTAKSYFGSTILLVGTIGEPVLDYTYEPESATTKNWTTEYDQVSYTGNTEGVEEFSLILGGAEFEAIIELFAAEGSTKLPLGDYAFNSTATAGTALASPGGDANKDYPSFIATDISDNGYGAAYYLTEGKVTVAIEEGDTVYTVAATSYNGSTINITTIGGSTPDTDDEISFDDFKALGDTENAVTVTEDLTVIFQNFQSLYVHDGDDVELIYGTEVRDGGYSFVNGDVISGVCGTYQEYNGAGQMVLESIATTGTTTDPIAPEVVTAEELTTADMNQYVRIEGAKLTKDVTYATGSAQSGYIECGADEMVIRNQFRTLEGTYNAGDVITAEGFVSQYNGAIQLYLTSIKLGTGIDSAIEDTFTVRGGASNIIVEAQAGAEVRVLTLAGSTLHHAVMNENTTVINNIPQGMHLVMVGNKSFKVVVK